MKVALITGKKFIIISGEHKDWYMVVEKETGIVVAEIKGLADVMRTWRTYEKAGSTDRK